FLRVAESAPSGAGRGSLGIWGRMVVASGAGMRSGGSFLRAAEGGRSGAVWSCGGLGCGWGEGRDAGAGGGTLARPGLGVGGGGGARRGGGVARGAGWGVGRGARRGGGRGHTGPARARGGPRRGRALFPEGRPVLVVHLGTSPPSDHLIGSLGDGFATLTPHAILR